MSSRRDSCAAVLFLAGIFAAAIFLCLGALPQPVTFENTSRPKVTADSHPQTQRVAHPLRNQVSNTPFLLSKADETLTSLWEDSDANLNELLDRDHAFIELYGGAQRLLGRQVMEDADPQYTVVKLTDGLLTFASMEPQQEDMTVRAREMAEFVQRVDEEYDTPVLYIQAPSKLDVAQLPQGVTDYSDAEADQFLSLLEEAGVDTLDLRPAFQKAAQEDQEAAPELFFHTDHHWTPAGAFLGYQVLCEKLEKSYRFRISEELTDPKSFQQVTFGDAFLGSQGRRTGSLYAGLDDLEIWTPTFSTDFSYTVPIVGIEREGPFVTTLLFPERLADKDFYDSNPYTIYSGGDYLLSRAVNRDNPRGKRVLILRDSFGCAFTPFLSLACQEVMAIDPRHFNGNQDTMLHYIDWLEPDLILVMNTSSSLRVDKLFPYLPTARAQARADKAAEDAE